LDVLHVSFLDMRHVGLNTCVGEANYASFFRTLLSLCAMEMVHFAVQLYLVIDILIQGPDRVDRSWIQNSAGVLVLLFLFLVLNCFSLALLGQLIVFHLSLQRNNLTTYEFIVRDHQAKRAAARREGDIEAHRVVRMAEAQRDGHALRVRQLQMGGACRQCGLACCDPLDLPEPPPEPDPEAGFAHALGSNAGATWKNSANEMAAHNEDDNDEDDNDYDDNDHDGQDSRQSGLSAVGVFDTPRENDYHNPNHGGSSSSSSMVEKQSDTVAGQPLVDLMYEAGISMSSLPGRGELDQEDDDNEDPSNGHDDTDLDDSPIKEIQQHHHVAVEGMEESMPLSHSSQRDSLVVDEDDEQYGGVEVDVFDNEPDDLSYHSGCSAKSGKSGRSGRGNNGERDYTAF
jgi:DHHC palmitoyltransferase